MKKKIGTIFVAVIMCLSLTAYSYASTVSDLEDKQDKIEEDRKDAQKELNDVKNQKTKTLSQIEELNNQIVDTQEQLKNLNGKIVELEGSITQTQKDIEEAQEHYETQQKALEERIVAQYKAGKTSYLDVLLNSTSFSNFLSKYYLVGKIAKADNQLLEDINTQKEEIEAKKASLEQQKKEMDSAKAEVQKENVTLNNTKASKNQQMSNLSASEKEIQNKIEEFYKQETQLDEQIKQAEKNNSGGGQYTGGQFLWPCPASKRITSYFGNREQPVAGASTYHKGIDVGAPYGSDIIAAADGTVTISTYSKSAGNYIMLNHGGGLNTVYMHASKLLVSVGTKVSKGQVIAKVGSTGYSTGNHLHFGVRKNGTYVNPLGYVQ